jgi:stage III sporulation protein AA
LPLIVQSGRLFSMMIVSPPGLGKTTLLRDIARSLSMMGFSVSIVDERSEIAACVHGVPTLDVGPNTDVLDACPKAAGIPILLRAMSPQVIITDELGGPSDALAISEAKRCGVCVIASAHATDVSNAKDRPALREALNANIFDFVVTLRALGEIGEIVRGNGEKIAKDLFRRDGGLRLYGDGNPLV